MLLSHFSRVHSVRTHRQQPTSLCRPWDSPGKSAGVGYHCLLQCMKVKKESEVAQSCPTLSDPMDHSLPGSSVHGIFQARVLEWGAIAFSNSRMWLIFHRKKKPREERSCARSHRWLVNESKMELRHSNKMCVKTARHHLVLYLLFIEV